MNQMLDNKIQQYLNLFNNEFISVEQSEGHDCSILKAEVPLNQTQHSSC